MPLLPTVNGPDDLRRLSLDQCSELAAEIRGFLVETVSRTGGHLGPNLGVVELTIALHRAFDSPRDALLFDTGHQAYVHKILTGRRDFSRLRQQGGLSGYPSRAESPHDWIENSHASTALSYADGLAKAFALRGETDRSVVALVGDGSLTGGMAWEALNNIAGAPDRSVVILVNDNGRSYSPTIGGVADHLAALRLTRSYELVLDAIKRTLARTPLLGPPLYDALHGIKTGLKDALSPQGMFEDLGLKYVGPIDGHDVGAVEQALRRAKGFGGPVIVHAITQKGRGFAPAENDEADRYHGVGVLDPVTGRPVLASAPSWTSVFADEIVTIGERRDDVVAITAAMLQPVGLTQFAQRFPERTFDVGIAEQHAVTSAAGLAMGGMHPVVAVYATFLNRAFDQVLLDVALHRLPVTFVLDRAGVTGDDGASHNGMWDLSVLQVVPGLRLAAPRDGARLRELLGEAVDDASGPTCVRFPKGPVVDDVPALERLGEVDVLRRDGDVDVLVVSVGAMAGLCLEVADGLRAQGVGVTVVDPRWVKPLDPVVIALGARHRLVVTVEDNGRVGGVAAAVAQALRDAGVHTPAKDIGLPQHFFDHAKRAEVLAACGITARDVVRDVVETVARLDAALERVADERPTLD